MSNEKFETRNISEDMIDSYLNRCIESSEMCQCQRCHADVRAIALNNFPPHYVVSDMGDLLVRAKTLSNQFQVDIIIAIMLAIKVVQNNPRHKGKTRFVPMNEDEKKQFLKKHDDIISSDKKQKDN